VTTDSPCLSLSPSQDYQGEFRSGDYRGEFRFRRVSYRIVTDSAGIHVEGGEDTVLRNDSDLPATLRSVRPGGAVGRTIPAQFDELWAKGHPLQFGLVTVRGAEIGSVDSHVLLPGEEVTIRPWLMLTRQSFEQTAALLDVEVEDLNTKEYWLEWEAAVRESLDEHVMGRTAQASIGIYADCPG
jgi:hypothetical protein